MAKQTQLLTLAKLRQRTQYPGYKRIGDYHAGAYECDFVSPYTKTAGNIDAEIMVILQDWASDGVLGQGFHEPSARLGHDPNLPTNRNLSRLLDRFFSFTLRDVYGTNLFPFVKLGGMSASIRQADLDKAARQFALPQIRVVNPRLVICLGLVTFNALRKACDLKGCSSIQLAIGSPFSFGAVRVWCQAHTGAFGQNNRNKGRVDRVSYDWNKMKVEFRTTGNGPLNSSHDQRAVQAAYPDCGRKMIRVAKSPLKKSDVSIPLIHNGSRERQMIYFNNCQGKNHSLYGKGAFYDLWSTDPRAANLSAGQECIVATKAKDGDITFSWFSLSHEAPNRYEGRPSRVFYGDFIKSQTYSKAEAARTEPYSTFFDKNGNFKRQSVIVK